MLDRLSRRRQLYTRRNTKAWPNDLARGCEKVGDIFGESFSNRKTSTKQTFQANKIMTFLTKTYYL